MGLTGIVAAVFDHAATYTRIRARLLRLADDLDADQAATTVPATPAWRVKDVYAHLAGANADLVAGRLDGVATDPWTEAQVSERRSRTLIEICEEWRALAPLVDELVASLGDAMDPRLCIDAWTHEQDVRGALGIPGGADDPFVADAAVLLTGRLFHRIPRRGLPHLEVSFAGGPVVRSGEPAEETLTVEPFEFARGVMGRRSRGQLLAWNWSAADPAPYVDALLVFGIAEDDIIDATA